MSLFDRARTSSYSSSVVSTCVSILYHYSASNVGVTLKSGLDVIRGRSKWHRPPICNLKKIRMAGEKSADIRINRIIA